METKAKMRKYNVYRIAEGQGCFARSYRNDFIGETWAISEKKACSNIRFRCVKEGNYDLLCPIFDSYGEGRVDFHLEAFPASVDPHNKASWFGGTFDD